MKGGLITLLKQGNKQRFVLFINQLIVVFLACKLLLPLRIQGGESCLYGFPGFGALQLL